MNTGSKILSFFAAVHGWPDPEKFHRTITCGKHPLGSDVAICRDRESGVSFLSGLMRCGSVWACPICAPKIQERRREEIALGIAWAYAQGLQPVMVTLTFPHTAWQELQELLKNQSTAFKLLRGGKRWQSIKSRIGFAGLIRSLEITHGPNGWHPHTHELWFVRADVDAGDLKELILDHWERACAKAGLLPGDRTRAFRERAVDVRGWCDASAYLTKQGKSRHWGVDRELAKATSKVGKASGDHPFGLLERAAAGDRQAGRLYVEYVQATRGRAQLYWSPGLKEKSGVAKMSDQELVVDFENAEVLGTIPAAKWWVIFANAAQARVLDAVDAGGWSAVIALIDSLPKRVDDAINSPVVRVHAVLGKMGLT